MTDLDFGLLALADFFAQVDFTTEARMVPELIEVITTTAEKNDAQTIASLLVERRLAACVQVNGPLDSNYWWNDRIETAREWQVVIKTRGELFASVEAAIREVHTYDEPEILALPVVAVSSGYRNWLLAQLAIPPKKPGKSEPASEKLTESAILRTKRSDKK